ncbi:MAG: LapA family protein [Legionella sp.]|nr:LapA family protein [Legionella sp.]
MRIIMLIIYILLIIIGVSFAALNAASVDVNFYFKTVSMPISVLITLMLGIGILIGFVLFIARYWRLKAECHRVKNQLKMTEKEIKNLRSIPLQDQH